MGVRGRKSTASLTVAATSIPGQRPQPPDDLTVPEAEEWRAVVARMPADWFPRETHALLVEFCRAKARSARVAAQLNQLADLELSGSEGLDRFNKLTQCAEREARIIQKTATSMRLAQQSRYDTQKAAAHTRPSTDGGSAKPWERFKAAN